MDTIQILDTIRNELACLKADYHRNPTVKKYNEVCFMERKLAQYTARAENRTVLSMGGASPSNNS